MTLYLVRHGETAANRESLGLGRSDPPLTELGARQAEAVAALLSHVPVAAIWSSPLRRARDTAAKIATAAGVPLTIERGLLELDIGDAEGLPLAEVRRRWPEFIESWRGPHPEAVAMPGGESLEGLGCRLRPLLPRLQELEPAGIVVVSHAFALRILACLLLGLPLSSFRMFACDLASVSVLELAPRPLIRAWNERCHLAPLEPLGGPSYGVFPR